MPKKKPKAKGQLVPVQELQYELQRVGEARLRAARPLPMHPLLQVLPKRDEPQAAPLLRPRVLPRDEAPRRMGEEVKPLPTSSREWWGEGDTLCGLSPSAGRQINQARYVQNKLPK